LSMSSCDPITVSRCEFLICPFYATNLVHGDQGCMLRYARGEDLEDCSMYVPQGEDFPRCKEGWEDTWDCPLLHGDALVTVKKQ
jgi:hypothetical protein